MVESTLTELHWRAPRVPSHSSHQIKLCNIFAMIPRALTSHLQAFHWTLFSLELEHSSGKVAVSRDSFGGEKREFQISWWTLDMHFSCRAFCCTFVRLHYLWKLAVATFAILFWLPASCALFINVYEVVARFSDRMKVIYWVANGHTRFWWRRYQHPRGHFYSATCNQQCAHKSVFVANIIDVRSDFAQDFSLRNHSRTSRKWFIKQLTDVFSASNK